jgi:hypothetical protein
VGDNMPWQTLRGWLPSTLPKRAVQADSIHGALSMCSPTISSLTPVDAGEGDTVDDRVSLRAVSKSGESEGDTEDDPVGPMTPGPTDSHVGETVTTLQ